MTTRELDITGTLSPYCLLVVQNKAKTLRSSDELLITCDHMPAATTFIPRLAREEGLAVDSERIAPCVWKIRLSKK